MQHDRVFRITEEDIDDLREHKRFASLISAYEHWLRRVGELDDLVHQIEAAFSGQTLGDGIGLLEADGIDDYAGVEVRARLRSQDESKDWRRIDVETLNRCYAAPSFLDARGFVFHLPAFLIAELNDNYHNGFIDHLINAHLVPQGWIELLTQDQRNAIAATLQLVADHPEYQERSDEMRLAVHRILRDVLPSDPS